MRPYLLAAVLLFACSCKNNKDTLVKVTKDEIRPDKLIANKGSIDYGNRIGLFDRNGKILLLNISKKGTLDIYDLASDEYKSISLQGQIPAESVTSVCYGPDTTYLVAGNSLFSISTVTGQTDSLYQLPLSENEFVISNLYNPSLKKNSSVFYIQYGLNDAYNYIDSSVYLFFNKDTQIRKIKYPDSYRHHYVHYTEVASDISNDTLYYIGSTDNHLAGVSLKTGNSILHSLAPEGYLIFDTTRMKDMKYIYDYTYETKYNMRLFVSDKYVFLLQRTPGKKEKEKGIFYLLTFDKKLDLVKSIKIDHPVDPHLVFKMDDKMVFISIKDKKKYSYEILL